MDQELRELERIFKSDPENMITKVKIIKLKARITGDSDLLIMPLLEGRVWRNTSTIIQDLAIQEVSSRLGESWKLVGDKTFSFVEEKGGLKLTGNGMTYINNINTKTINNRIAYFEYNKEIFNLIPGGSIRKKCCRYELCKTCYGNGYAFESFCPRLVKKYPFEMDYNTAIEWCKNNNFKLPFEIYFEYLVLGGKEDILNLENSFGLINFGIEWTDGVYIGDEGCYAITTRIIDNRIALWGKPTDSKRIYEIDSPVISSPVLSRPIFDVPETGLKLRP